jgi:hypothetical protein
MTRPAGAADNASGLAVLVAMPMLVAVIVMLVFGVLMLGVLFVAVRGTAGMVMIGAVLVMTVLMIMSMMAMLVMAVAMVVMPMIMVVMVTVMVRVLMRGGVAVIRLERRCHGPRLEAAFLEKKRDLRRVGHAQAVGENLHRNVTVAQRQDEPRGLGEILLAHLQHRLDLGDDLDQPAVVEQQEIVGAQQRRRREIEFDAGALAAEHEALLLGAVLVFEQHGIDDVARGLSGAEDFLSARHGMIRFQ